MFIDCPDRTVGEVMRECGDKEANLFKMRDDLFGLQPDEKVKPRRQSRKIITTFGDKFDCASDAATFLGVSVSNIFHAIKGNATIDGIRIKFDDGKPFLPVKAKKFGSRYTKHAFAVAA